MVAVFLILFLGCSVAAKEYCDRVQISFEDQKGITTNQNFTKQSFEKNGKPVYYSFRRTAKNQQKDTIIWWQIENNTWLSQTRPSSGDKITKTKEKVSPFF